MKKISAPSAEELIDIQSDAFASGVAYIALVCVSRLIRDGYPAEEAMDYALLPNPDAEEVERAIAATNAVHEGGIDGAAASLAEALKPEKRRLLAELMRED